MLLLEEEKDPERKIERTTIAFNAAANNGQIALVRELSQPSLPISDSAVRAVLLSFGNKLYIENFFATAELLVGTLENINEHNEASETILHQAVNDYAPILIIILLRFGANTEVRNNYGETALHLAAKRGPSSSVVLLLDAGANTEGTTYDRAYTPLHTAAQVGHFDVMRMLVERGANIHAEKSGGETAAHIALARNFEAIASYLIHRM